MTERELIERCLNNDPKSQRRLFEQFAGTMMTVCRRYARDQKEAEDILPQDMWQRIPGKSDVPGAGNPWRWYIILPAILAAGLAGGRFFGGHPRLAGYLFGNPSVHRPHTRQARPLQPPIPLYFPSPSANRLKGNRLPCPNPEHLKENSGWFVEAYFSPDILFASNRQDFSYSLTVIPIPFFPPDFPDLVNSMLNIEFYGNHQKHPK